MPVLGRPHVRRTPPHLAPVAALLAMVLVQGCAARPPAVSAPAPDTARHRIPPTVVPAPASLASRPGQPFVLSRLSTIRVPADSSTRAVGEWLASQLDPATGFTIQVVSADTPRGTGGDIVLQLDTTIATAGEEAYELTVDERTIAVRARRPVGVFRAAQTIRLLLPYEIESDMLTSRVPWTVAPVQIADAPRFAWRGAMLDVARHFFTVKEVKQFVDLLALYKLNVLHLHLADDQGWRIEIRSRPLLTQVGGASQVGGREGGYYTQADYAEIVRYARERYVTVVPEIDMPGHTNAALSAYPALSCSTRPARRYTGTDVGWSTFCVDSEATYALVDDVVRELAALTPGDYMHLGGDEVQALTPAQYARFVERVQGIVASHGKRMIGWEEIVQARLAPTTLAQQWRSDSVVKALAYGARVVLSPARRAYLDMKYTADTELGLRWAGLVPLRQSYDWDPATAIPGVGEEHIAGIEAPIWSETLRNIGAVQYLAVPRLPALAEVAWSPQGSRDWEGFRARIAGQAPRWRLLGINYFPSLEIAW